jgi:hypothetical protein
MEREGRNTRYRASIPLMLEVIAYLTAECCSGSPEYCSQCRTESGIDAGLLPACCENREPQDGEMP